MHNFLSWFFCSSKNNSCCAIFQLMMCNCVTSVNVSQMHSTVILPWGPFGGVCCYGNCIGSFSEGLHEFLFMCHQLSSREQVAARFCVEVFYMLYINFHSFTHSSFRSHLKCLD